MENRGGDFRTRNIEALRRARPALAAYLENFGDRTSSQPTLELIATRSGLPSGRYCGVTLHSRHNPAEEAERLFRRADAGMACYLLEGFGMGYLAEAALRLSPASQLLIIEPDLQLFLQVLGCRDLTELLSSDRVSYFFEITQEAIDRYLGGLSSAAVGVVRFRPLYERHRDLFDRVDAAVENHLTRIEVNRNTLSRFGRLWVRNLALNLPVFERARPLSSLAGRYAGLPGLLLGGGPSLDEVLPLLPELARRCVVVAVDTSLGACLAAGVEPDFVVVVDPQYWNTRHIDRCAAAGSVLISESSTHPRVFRLLEGPVYFCSSLFPLGEYLEEQTGVLGKLGAGGSVSTSAWDFLRLAGCDPIFTTGIDLGFPERQTHFRGSYFEERIHTLGGRLEPSELHMFRYLTDAGLFAVPDNSGGTVFTDKRMIIYRWWFERQAARFPAAHTRSLSPHAVRLSGIPFVPVEEPLDLPDVRERIGATTAEALGDREETAAAAPGGRPHYRTRPGASERAAGAIRRAVVSLLGELEEIARLAREGVTAVAAARAAAESTVETAPFLQRLDAVDGEIAGLRRRDIAGFLLQKEMQEIVDRGHRKMELTDILASSETIYRGLLESAEYHRTCLRRGLSRLGN